MQFTGPDETPFPDFVGKGLMTIFVTDHRLEDQYLELIYRGTVNDTAAHTHPGSTVKDYRFTLTVHKICYTDFFPPYPVNDPREMSIYDKSSD